MILVVVGLVGCRDFESLGENQSCARCFDLEAETATVVDQMQVFPDPAASGGAAVGARSDNGGVAEMIFDAVDGGSFTVWALSWAEAEANNSFFVSVDDLEEAEFELPVADTYAWTQVNSGPPDQAQRFFDLTAGTHILRFRARELCTLLDKVIITDDLGFQPTVTQSTPPDARCNN